MRNKLSTIKTALLTLTLLISPLSNAIEITPFFGQMYGTDINDFDDNTDISVDDASHLGLSIAWQDSKHGQGQILLNYVSHDFTSGLNQQDYSLDIIYGHFNGIAQFRQQNYVTTVSLGVGGAYFDSEGGQELYPSLTAAIGTRYEFSSSLSFVTELRAYATVIDEDDDLFCKGETCLAHFDDAFWLDTAVSFGIAYRF